MVPIGVSFYDFSELGISLKKRGTLVEVLEDMFALAKRSVFMRVAAERLDFL